MSQLRWQFLRLGGSSRNVPLRQGGEVGRSKFRSCPSNSWALPALKAARVGSVRESSNKSVSFVLTICNWWWVAMERANTSAEVRMRLVGWHHLPSCASTERITQPQDSVQTKLRRGLGVEFWPQDRLHFVNLQICEANGWLLRAAWRWRPPYQVDEPNRQLLLEEAMFAMPRHRQRAVRGSRAQHTWLTVAAAELVTHTAYLVDGKGKLCCGWWAALVRSGNARSHKR